MPSLIHCQRMQFTAPLFTAPLVPSRLPSLATRIQPIFPGARARQRVTRAVHSGNFIRAQSCHYNQVDRTDRRDEQAEDPRTAPSLARPTAVPTTPAPRPDSSTARPDSTPRHDAVLCRHASFCAASPFPAPRSFPQALACDVQCVPPASPPRALRAPRPRTSARHTGRLCAAPPHVVTRTTFPTAGANAATTQSRPRHPASPVRGVG